MSVLRKKFDALYSFFMSLESMNAFFGDETFVTMRLIIRRRSQKWLAFIFCLDIISIENSLGIRFFIFKFLFFYSFQFFFLNLFHFFFLFLVHLNLVCFHLNFILSPRPCKLCSPRFTKFFSFSLQFFRLLFFFLRNESKRCTQLKFTLLRVNIQPIQLYLLS